MTEQQIREWLRTVLLRHNPPAAKHDGSDEPGLVWMSDPEMEHGLNVVLDNDVDFEIIVKLAEKN
jgi:hypothetical protein